MAIIFVTAEVHLRAPVLGGTPATAPLLPHAVDIFGLTACVFECFKATTSSHDVAPDLLLGLLASDPVGGLPTIV